MVPVAEAVLVDEADVHLLAHGQSAQAEEDRPVARHGERGSLIRLDAFSSELVA